MQVLCDEVEQPRTDDRKYRIIKLANGLEALLIQDETTDKASAALDVNVGAFSDPDDLPGLAHFLEHLLFMGTKKFPSENEYSKFLTDHAGSYNAYTSSENTNYYFDVSWQHLKGALDRFSQFFVSPLFDASCQERELLAVDSENKKNLSNDSWRLSQLEKSLCNPNHPYYKFSTGNLQTLGELPAQRGQDVREELIKFYKSHYTSTLMKLVVLGRESLDQLQDWVAELFTEVPDAHNEKQKWNVLPVASTQMGLITMAKPIMDINQLELRFLVPDSDHFYRKYPHNYFSHLIGHESEGSLLYYFKQNSWANALSCGSYPIGSGFEFFIVEVDLTKKGLESWKQVAKCIFEYISMLKQQGPKPWIFDELEKSSKAAFWYMQKIKPSTTASRYARLLQKPFPRQDILCSSIPRDYDASELERYLEFLNPQNVRFTLVSQTFDNLDRSEKWYGTQYSVTRDPELLEDLWAIKSTGRFHIPLRNQFVPDNFEVLDTSLMVQRPTLVIRNAGFLVWYKKDDTFDMPKGQINLKLMSAKSDCDVTAHMASELLVQMVNDALNDYTYYAEVAGLNYSLAATQNGIEIHLGGFNEKLVTLLQVIIDKLKATAFDIKRFNSVKERITRNIKNARYDNPYKQLNTQTSLCWLVEGMWPWHERLEAIGRIELKDIDAHRTQILQQLDLEFLIVGNFTLHDAKDIANQARGWLGCDDPLPNKVFKDSYWLPVGSHFNYAETLSDKAESNSAIDCRFQVCSVTDMEKRTLLDILCQIIKVPVFHTLRTKEQLGYIVGSYSRTLRGTVWLDIIAQSEKPTDYLEARVEALLVELHDLIEAMSDTEFQRSVTAVIDNNLEKFKSLRQETSSYWASIVKGYYDFGKRTEMVKLAREATKQQVLDLFDTCVGDKSSRRLFSIHLMNHGSTSKPAGTPVENISQFHASLERVGLPQPVHELEFYEKDEPKL